MKKELKNLRVVIFDLDDTLYNELDYVKCAMKNVANYIEDKHNLDRKVIYNRCIELLHNNGRGKIFDTIISENKIDEAASKLVEIYRNTKPQIHLYEDAIEYINYLKENQIYTAVITDGCSKVQHNKISALYLESLVDEIIITDDLKNGAKPSTLSYEIILKVFGIDTPKDCIYIGDNPKKDFIGAKKLGMNTARIIRPFGDNMKLEAKSEYDGKYHINLLTDLMKI